MRQTLVRFPAGELMLEGECCFPDGKGPFPSVVLCHPHSLYGGSMHTAVIVKLARALVGKDIAALAFNFRGVGGSEGKFGAGIEEQQDVLAALKWLGAQGDVDSGRMGLAGYSFGGGVVLEACCSIDGIKALALLAPSAVESGGSRDTCPAEKYVLGGSADDVITPHNLNLLFEHLSEPKKLEILDGADHFMAGFTDLAAEKMARFLEEKLKK